MKSFLVYVSEILAKGRNISDAMVLASKDEWTLVQYHGSWILAIHGTHGFREWLSNFRPNGWRTASKEVILEYEELFPHVKPDYVCGYSRGGALALLIAAEWNLRCVTFSSPRICGKDFELLLQFTPLMIVPKYDIVDLLPPFYEHPTVRVEAQVPGWRHSPKQIQKLSDKRIAKLAEVLNWGKAPDDKN